MAGEPRSRPDDGRCRIGGHPRGAVGVDVDSANDGGQEGQELGVVVRVVAGVEEFSPSSVPIDQLLCLPEPLIPTKGFSWARNMRSCLAARRRIVLMTIMLWSEPTEWARTRGHLELGRGDLVVAGLGRNARRTARGLDPS